jgi:hypothetical protein
MRHEFCISSGKTDSRVAAEACGAYQRAGATLPGWTYLLPLGLNLSLGSEVRLHRLRRSVVEKTTNAASSMGAREFREQERRGSVKQLTVAGCTRQVPVRERRGAAIRIKVYTNTCDGYTRSSLLFVRLRCRARSLLSLCLVGGLRSRRRSPRIRWLGKGCAADA